MKHKKRKRDASDKEAPPAEPAKNKRTDDFVVAQEERLTAEERKRLFASNLDRLIRLVGMNRKEVADEIGITHILVLRLVSAGISRVDPRNIKTLTKIASFFALPSVDDFWRVDLVRRLLSPTEGDSFVKRFRPRLLAERERRLVEAQRHSEDELALLSLALGFQDVRTTLTGPLAEKIDAILASGKAEQFKRLIDDYFHFTDADR
jgi:hypothetical protein